MTVIVKMINFGGNEEANSGPFHSFLLSGENASCPKMIIDNAVDIRY